VVGMKGGKEESAVGGMVGNSSAIPGRHVLIMLINWSTTSGRWAEITYHTERRAVFSS